MWAKTGYGVQAKYLLPRFQKMGHEVAQFAWYGLRGARIMAGDIPIYPGARDPWGHDIITAHVKDFRADVVVSLQDIWVLPEDYRERINVPWICWFPVDHDPPPSQVVARAKDADYPVVYSLFGLRAMREVGVECEYIPHGVDCEQYHPIPRAEAREKLGFPADAFLAGMVAANKGAPSRKAFPEQLQAFARFCQERPDLNPYLYLHTDYTTHDEGVDIRAIARSLGIEDRLLYVDLYRYTLG